VRGVSCQLALAEHHPLRAMHGERVLGGWGLGVCLPGAAGPARNVCVACPQNSFYNSAGLCQPCPLASATAKANYNVVPAVQSCLCDAGFVRELRANALDRCEACPAGTYEAGGACVSCGAGAHSAQGSTGVGSCMCHEALCKVRVWDAVCAGGCELALPPCAQCLPGHFKDAVSLAGNTDPCVQCPLHTFQEHVG